MNEDKNKLIDVNEYRERVADILVNEFGFEIMDEKVTSRKNGKKVTIRQKGKISNRNKSGTSFESISLSFNSFYDLDISNTGHPHLVKFSSTSIG